MRNEFPARGHLALQMLCRKIEGMCTRLPPKDKLCQPSRRKWCDATRLLPKPPLYAPGKHEYPTLFGHAAIRPLCTAEHICAESPEAIPLDLVQRYTAYPGLRTEDMPKDGTSKLERHTSEGNHRDWLIDMSLFASGKLYRLGFRQAGLQSLIRTTFPTPHRAIQNLKACLSLPFFALQIEALPRASWKQ